MITTPGAMELEKYRQAGRIAAECREWARENIRPGVQIRTVLETVEDMIRQRGGAPAFPAQSSRNHIAAHFCTHPDDTQTYEEGDCVKVDIGVHVDGYIADTATSVDLSTDRRWEPLITASSDALDVAIETARVGVSVGEIGAEVEKTICSAGFEPIRNLTGHGLARWKVHTPPQIPNYADATGGRIQEGSIIAIEPFSCTGQGLITEKGRAEVFMMVRPPRNAKGISRELMKAIESWRGLPLARRYFREFDLQAVDDAFNKLARQGSMMRFPPLVERENVMVAQTEHTLHVTKDGVEIITAA